VIVTPGVSTSFAVTNGTPVVCTGSFFSRICTTPTRQDFTNVLDFRVDPLFGAGPFRVNVAATSQGSHQEPSESEHDGVVLNALVMSAGFGGSG
jgi:hypothetical protein